MISTTLKTIVDSQASIQLLLDAKIPVKAAYAVSKLARACASEMEHYGEQRRKAFEAAGCVVKDNKWVHPDGEEALKEAVKTADELLDAKVELNALPLDLDQFGNGDIVGAAFFNLEWAMK